MQDHDYDPTGMTDRKWMEMTGKQSPVKAAQDAVDRIAAGYTTLDEEIERLGSSHEQVRARVEAERSAVERLGLRAPSWKAGHEGMPTDRDVWAYVYAHDTEDDIELARGRAARSDFKLAGDEWEYREIKDAACWIDTDERPAFSIEVVRAAIAALADLERTGQGHVFEDWLHREALRAVVAGHPDAQAIAAAALDSRAVKFTRYYS